MAAGEDGRRRAAGPLAGAGTHPSGSAPPSSGLTVVPESRTPVLPRIPAGGSKSVRVCRRPGVMRALRWPECAPAGGLGKPRHHFLG